MGLSRRVFNKEFKLAAVRRRRVSTTLRQPAWEFSDYFPLGLSEPAG